ncbi:MAG: acyltransferase [Alphaproteobacteria bacterium]|nr:acyltransferase [Alphaproteobacteria bacterium]
MQSTPVKRFHFIDHTRGFIIALVVLQHAVQAYGTMWGGLWFLKVPDRDSFYDGIFFFTDNFIMAALFFISGIFVIPSLKRRGLWNFTLEKIMRLVLPFIFGILFIVPWLTYPRYAVQSEAPLGLIDYWWQIYLFDNVRPGGFWFLAFLMGLTMVTAVLNIFLPFVIRGLGVTATWLVKQPVRGFAIFAILTALIISLSDLYWGAPWWAGFWSLFYARGNQFITYIFYFFLGVGVGQADVLNKTDVLEKLSENWQKWVLLTTVLAVLYIGYCLVYMYEGTFSSDLRSYFAQGGTWGQVGPLMADVLPSILIRTILNGLLCAAQTITVITVFYQFANTLKPFWVSLAACSYGIYVLHEPFVVWTQNALMDYTLPPFLKAVLAFIIGLSVAWFLTERVLRRIPGLKKVF